MSFQNSLLVLLQPSLGVGVAMSGYQRASFLRSKAARGQQKVPSQGLDSFLQSYGLRRLPVELTGWPVSAPPVLGQSLFLTTPPLLLPLLLTIVLLGAEGGVCSVEPLASMLPQGGSVCTRGSITPF